MRQSFSTSYAQITPAALLLSPADRAALAESLWESFGARLLANDIVEEDAALNLAEERSSEIDAGAVAPLSHEELMRRLGVYSLPPQTDELLAGE